MRPNPVLQIIFGLAFLLSPISIRLFAIEEGIDRRIERSDFLVIEVFNEKDLTVERRVQAGGTISYPLLGEVEVVGKSTAQVETMLKKRLGEDYLVNPEVSVTVKQYRARTVTVIGKVLKPGIVLLLEEEKTDIVQAIAQAQGFLPNADEDKIMFTRGGKTVRYRFKELMKITERSKKIWLEPGDVIEVKESLF
ncbi:MAG: polysaccharide export protein [Pedosphaera sp.]|nr:polysaccharide export protein [Pedosphaera sp.]